MRVIVERSLWEFRVTCHF